MASLNALIHYPRSIAVLSSGIFAGTSLSILYASVPAIKASKDPLPSFVVTYNKGKNIAIINILVSTIAYGYCYYETKEKKYLYSAILSFFSGPFTAFFIAPINNQLFALQKEKSYDVDQVKKLVDRWQVLHAARFIAPAIAFAINVIL
ncbi:unnamed protein product [Rhizopus stolonifer]